MRRVKVLEEIVYKKEDEHAEDEEEIEYETPCWPPEEEDTPSEYGEHYEEHRSVFENVSSEH
jgi:hypothetical protein